MPPKKTTKSEEATSHNAVKMPPKKAAKSDEHISQNSAPSDKSSKAATKSEAKSAKVEAPTRTLRPRKPPAEPEAPKPKAAKASKKATNGVADGKKTTAKGKRKNDKTTEDGEPESKVNKQESEADDTDHEEQVSASSIYEFKANSIKGEEISLSKYKGHICIIVNVASRCGHTPSNYKEFVELYDKYSKNKGLRILAFPCNQFGKQEPGDNDKICDFATNKGVKFDMFEKIDVNGKNAHPLWKYLTSQKDGPKGSKIEWNFTKFLINKEGQVVERFKPAVKPLALVKELEKLW